MKALLRKELSGLLRESLLAGLLGAAGLIALGRSVLDYGPPGREFDEGGKLWALFCVAAGATMGFFQLRQERSQGTEAYLHHRATGPGGAFRAKAVAGLLCLLLILLLELSLHVGWFLLFSDAAALVRWERLGHHLALATLLVSSYGVGLWTSAIPRREPTRVLLLLLALMSLYLLSAGLTLRWDGGPDAPVARFVLAQLAFGALLIAQAHRLQRAACEPERPLDGRLALALLPPAVLFFGLPLAQLPTGLQAELREALLRDMPHVVRDAQSGEIFALAPTPEGFVRVDGHGDPLPEPASEDYTGWGYKPEARIVTLYDPRPRFTPLCWASAGPPPLRREFAGKAFEFDAPFVHVRALGRGPQAAWFDPTTGRVLAVEAGREGRRGLRHLGRPGGVPFSTGTVPIFDGDGGACLVDRSDHTAWRLADGTEGPELLAAPLPGGERLLDVERVHGLWRVRVGLFEPYGVSDQLVARGEHGLWAWSSAGWVPREPDAGEVLESKAVAAIVLSLRLANEDVLLPRLEVLDARTDALLFAFAYEARTLGQRLALLGAQALTVLRPPLVSLVALQQPSTAFDRTLPGPFHNLVLDPALGGGRRAWLVALGLAGALWLARSAWRFLGDSPADRARRIVWVAVIASLGWPAFLALTLIEPRRARLGVSEPRGGQDVARPLIASG